MLQTFDPLRTRRVLFNMFVSLFCPYYTAKQFYCLGMGEFQSVLIVLRLYFEGFDVTKTILSLSLSL